MKIKVNKEEYELDVAAALKSGVAKKVVKTEVKKKSEFNGYDKYHYSGNYYEHSGVQLILVKSSFGFVFVCLEDGTVWDGPFKTKNSKFATRNEIKQNVSDWEPLRSFKYANYNGPAFEIIHPKESREIKLDGRSYSLNEDAARKCGFLIPQSYEVGDVFSFDVTNLLLVEFTEDTFGFVDIFTGLVYKEFSISIADKIPYPFTFHKLASILGASFKRVNMKFESGSKLDAYRPANLE